MPNLHSKLQALGALCVELQGEPHERDIEAYDLAGQQFMFETRPDGEHLHLIDTECYSRRLFNPE